MDIVAGIDLGGTDTKFGLVTKEGELLAYHSIPTDPDIDYNLFFDKLTTEIQELVFSLEGTYQLVGIGLGAPTGSQKHGTIDSASNLKWPEKLPIADILSARFQLPVTVSNDANAAAIGEIHYGIAKGSRNLMCITLGTGLGCGLIVDGNLVLGSQGHAGELGHIIAVENGRKCACGRYGCLETYASATGMVRSVLEKSDKDLKQSLLGSFDPQHLSSKKITNAAMAGDKLALDVFDYTGKILGKTLANTIALLNPELIILTGGLAKAGDFLLNPTISYTNYYLLDMYKGSVEIKVSEMNNKKTAILGTAAFMWMKLQNLPTTI